MGMPAGAYVLPTAIPRLEPHRDRHRAEQQQPAKGART
jgi:hypothetical protein